MLATVDYSDSSVFTPFCVLKHFCHDTMIPSAGASSITCWVDTTHDRNMHIRVLVLGAATAHVPACSLCAVVLLF
jgi:hypothetical protein